MNTSALLHRRLRVPTWHCRRGVTSALLLLAALGGAAPALANDRPFQMTNTAVAEEDDEQSWSVESWAERFGTVRSFSIAAEYSFTPRTSLQFELARAVDRADDETGREGEVEFKHLFNDIARDGWGWGIGGTLNTTRLHEGGGNQTTVALHLPFSVALWNSKSFLHLNGGLEKAGDAPRRFTSSVAIESTVMRRTVLFAEVGRDTEGSVAQVGARQWIQRERFAVDFALQQHRSEGQRSSGFIVGVGFYDL